MWNRSGQEAIKRSSYCLYTNENWWIYCIGSLSLKCIRLESVFMAQNQDVNPNIAFQRAWGGIKNSRMSKHDTRKVLRNRHSSLIEPPGLYSSPWLYYGKHERQTKISITGGAGCCHLSKQPKTMWLDKTASADDAFSLSLLRNISLDSDSRILKVSKILAII